MTGEIASSVVLGDIAERAAREAGAVAAEGFRSPGMAFETKNGFHDFVTEYDGRSEQRARAVIEQHLPGAHIVGEEEGASGQGEITWYIDPIDGTSNFARGIALWGVVIAAVRGDEVVAGVVYDPVADQLWRADERGAFLNGAALRARGMTVPERATVLATFPPANTLVTRRIEKLEALAQLADGFAHVRDLGSAAIALCYVATGWADANFGFNIHPWDVAAPAFILRQAGGVYRSYGDGQLLPESRDHHNSVYFGTVTDADFPLIDAILRSQTRTDASV
ncbi:inositol monophosphatase family protein [Microbacterium sp.]|uniref:inositol monophosphatase family protein n=1 Tax=Microbacterium sp. TaxID=51671 RepID=UPI002811C9AD|nr:inositol monophosphatase family protein [Microbacterium sp.]